MKKILAMMLTAAMMLSMGTAVFAEEVTYSPSESETFEQIFKSYVSENNVQVSETLSFTSTPDTDNPDTEKNLTVTDLVVTNGMEELPITVTIPSYDKVGIYKYTIKEDGENTAGVTYTNSVIRVAVMVEYVNTETEHKLQIADVESYILKVNGEKTDDFVNTFKSGSFSVAKDVTGNMANENDEFEISVTLTCPEGMVIGTPITVGGETVTADEWVDGVYTTTLTLSEADGATTFADIPVGVVVTVKEEDVAEDLSVGTTGYDYVSTKVGDEDFTSLTIADETNSAIVVTNEKTTEVDTGISVDSIPYIAMLGVVAIGGTGFMVSKKRRSED